MAEHIGRLSAIRAVCRVDPPLRKHYPYVRREPFMGTNADHQRAWRQRQKLRIAALEASKPKKNRLAKDGEPISALISELLAIKLEFLPRVEATVAALGSRIDNELRDGLFDTLHAVANEMSRVAQSLPTEPILLRTGSRGTSGKPNARSRLRPRLR